MIGTKSGSKGKRDGNIRHPFERRRARAALGSIEDVGAIGHYIIGTQS
jgi:hypothetical protein